MTTRTTTIRASSTGMRALIGAAAAGLAVLGGALLWQTRPASEHATPAPGVNVGTPSDGVAPIGGMAELYRDQAVVAAEAPPFAVPALTDGTGHYSTAQPRGGMGELFGEQQADRFAEEAARIGALGGWDTPYRASPVSTCATGDDGRAC